MIYSILKWLLFIVIGFFVTATGFLGFLLYRPWGAKVANWADDKIDWREINSEPEPLSNAWFYLVGFLSCLWIFVGVSAISSLPIW